MQHLKKLLFTMSSSGVASTVEEIWQFIRGDIKAVVNNVLFPIMDLVLLVMLIIKLANAYFDYKKNGQMDLREPAMLFVGLLFALASPLFIWKIIGMG